MLDLNKSSFKKEPNFSIKNAAGNAAGIVYDTGAAIELYLNGNKKLETS